VPQLYRRQDIWTLEEQQPWHPITEAYAVAIGAMQKRGAADPTSWAYQAAVHALSAGRSDKFRDQCQHGSWFFLPWHRMYLYWFERIVRAALAADPRVSDDVKKTWALPYWNYGRRGHYSTLPPPFREPTHNGRPNPLYVGERAGVINGGGALPAQIVSAAVALQKQVFARTALPGRTAGFGGPVTGWNHEPSSAFGALEQTPHNDVHTQVGGATGFMSQFDTAPLDPIFWLHHANIDRLWAVWLTQANRSNPTQSKWRDFKFHFHDENGKPLQSTPAGVLDTAPDLGYIYEPAPTPPKPAAPPPAAAVSPPGPPPEHPPELIAATDEPLTLRGRPLTVAVDIAPPQSPQVIATPEAERRAYLNVEGIAGERNPGISYGVYLNLPEAPEATTPEDAHYVGNISFFGIERVRDTTRDHRDSDGLRHAFNITPLIESLRAAGTWNPEKLTVTFKPLRPTPAEGQADLGADEPIIPVTIGRVSLYLQ
jgi:tyrosinase